MKKVLIYGSYNHNNLGDDLMMHLINNLLNDNEIDTYYFKSNKISNCFNDNYKYIENPYYDIDYKQKKIKRYYKLIKWNEIEKYDAIIFMGGGYTSENFGIKNLFKIYLLCKKSKRKKVNIFFTGQTIGPVKTLLYRLLVKRIYKLADLIYVREKYSMEYLNRNGIKGKLTGDDAFIAYPKLQEIQENNYLIYNYKSFNNYKTFQSDYFKLLLRIAKKNKQPIKIVSFRIDVESEEYKENLKLHNYLKNNNIDSEFIFLNSAEKIYNLFKNCYGVIGTAYHCITIGLICGKRVIGGYNGEYYKNKMKGILSWYKIENNCLYDISQIGNNMDEYEKLICNELKQNRKKESLDISKKIYDNVYNEWLHIIDTIKNGGEL